jgi:hypothetical protein
MNLGLHHDTLKNKLEGAANAVMRAALAGTAYAVLAPRVHEMDAIEALCTCADHALCTCGTCCESHSRLRPKSSLNIVAA